MQVSEQELRAAIAKSKTITDVAKTIGFSYCNGRIQKKINGWIENYQIDASHLHKYNRNSKYEHVIRNCPVCYEEFKTQIGSPEERVTCSYKCANTYFSATKHTAAANEKRRIAQLIDPIEKTCNWCKNNFKTKRKKQIFCNRKCAASFKMSLPENQDRLRQTQLNLIASGKHQGWLSRGKMKRSFPEKVSEECLNELGFQREKDFKIELLCGKWFIDFAFVERKIAIEIDGKQHQYPERIAKDKEKDAHLSSEGWAVHRIAWKKLTKITRKELKQKLTDILVFNNQRVA